MASFNVEDELNQMKREMGYEPAPSFDRALNEGANRIGRIALWLALPPVGLWRSVRHGKLKHEDRLAKKIADELNNSERS